MAIYIIHMSEKSLIQNYIAVRRQIIRQNKAQVKTFKLCTIQLPYLTKYEAYLLILEVSACH